MRNRDDSFACHVKIQKNHHDLCYFFGLPGHFSNNLWFKEEVIGEYLVVDGPSLFVDTATVNASMDTASKVDRSNNRRNRIRVTKDKTNRGAFALHRTTIHPVADNSANHQALNQARTLTHTVTKVGEETTHYKVVPCPESSTCQRSQRQTRKNHPTI